MADEEESTKPELNRKPSILAKSVSLKTVIPSAGGPSQIPEQPQLQPAVLEAQASLQLLLKEGKHNYYRPLYHAANEGDWKTVKSFIDRDPTALTTRITADSLTVLMVAARARKWKLVEVLISKLSSESLAMQSVTGFTALHYVVVSGNLKTAQALIKKNPSLPQILDNSGYCPLFISLHSKCKDLVWYLVSVTKHQDPCLLYTGPRAVELIQYLLTLGYYDIALYLFKKYPYLAVGKDDTNCCWLKYLPVNYSDFLSGSKLHFWEKWIYKLIHVESRDSPPMFISINMEDQQAVSTLQRSTIFRGFEKFQRLLLETFENLAPPIKHVREEKLKHLHLHKLVDYVFSEVSDTMNLEEITEFFGTPNVILQFATAMGTLEIVEAFLHYFPDFLLVNIADNCNMLQAAIQLRQSKIFKLITREMPTLTMSLAYAKDEFNNTVLHLAAKRPPPLTNTFTSVAGAAFEMQRELQWFQEVKKVTPGLISLTTNNAGQTPQDLFTQEHKALVESGEKWMKDTANSGVIVTTLITTVVLAAAFTVPGGNNDNGIPNFLDKTSFLIFIVSDALALFSSTTSLLMFVSILTARYEEKDFIRALPKRVIIGLGSLFFAIVCMMVAFGATLYIVVGEIWPWAYIPIILLGLVPVTVFAMLQLPLFFQMIDSTYGSGVFGS